MTWYSHPKYLVAKNQFISDISAWQLTNLHYILPKIVFICGGQEATCPNRGILENYFKKYLPRYLTFRAEDAWEIISERAKSVNALSLEEWLAGFSDVVIILVESFGTVAELGAFSMSEPLRKKLLPVLNANYADQESFINTGPVKWVDNDSKFRPCIHTNFESILTAIPDIEKRIKKPVWFSQSEQIVHGKYSFSNKVMIFFLLHILVALGPISISEIVHISNRIIEYKDKQSILLILSIGVALGIFDIVSHNKNDYYYCNDFEKLFNTESIKKLSHRINASRAKSLSSLQKIDRYMTILNKAVSNAT